MNRANGWMGFLVFLAAGLLSAHHGVLHFYLPAYAMGLMLYYAIVLRIR